MLNHDYLNKFVSLLTQLLVLLLIAGCQSRYQNSPTELANVYQLKQPASCKTISKSTSDQSSLERDLIYGLLAYSVVLKDWQTDADYEDKTIRGHNIGSVLVNEKDTPVFWARNSNYKTNNGSQHGEVRAIRNYLESYKERYLKGFTIYTTLEPCAMCTGMASLTQISRVVYGQKDPDYGDAAERLFKDLSQSGGFKPYPRTFESIALDSPIKTELDSAYQSTEMKSITRWLRRADTKTTFSKAKQQLFSMQTAHKENSSVLSCAKDFYSAVSDDYVKLKL